MFFIIFQTVSYSRFFVQRSVSRRGNYLHFSHITPNDAGRYFCTAQNVHGNVTKVAQVIVNRNEIIDNGQGGQRVQEVVEGETISLYCRSPHENASPSTIVSFRKFFFD